ncbi:response regulator transcription factor [Paenibacillus agricola]|uniref:Response regulator transcription factor n=1 Tax=Paenibacillus agricola TaxID=2716264 RepID=A0ABX0J723_9BACL|nr:response regulator transcription factor [Paenibacillus agricola]NHN31937.1 response regulator transcription factor [Paenibacillus agricola]
MHVTNTVQSDLSQYLLQQVNETLQASTQKQCGLILAHISQASPIELQDLETRLSMEKDQLAILTSYGPSESLLAIILPDQPLGYTHFLSLSTKDFLMDAGLLTGKITTASFPESAQPTREAITEMVTMTAEQAVESEDIQVFHPSADPQATPSIVLIDQNTDMLDFLSARLGHQGYDVRPAQDGIEGLDLINETPPDLVITELNLPALDGYQLIHRIRQSHILKNLCKIMVLTDMGLEQEFTKCFDLGVSDVLTKPFSPIELEARIRRLLVLA